MLNNILKIITVVPIALILWRIALVPWKIDINRTENHINNYKIKEGKDVGK